MCSSLQASKIWIVLYIYEYRVYLMYYLDDCMCYIAVDI